MGLLDSLFPPAIAAEDAYAASIGREVVILDVREPHEWKAGHAPGSKNVPLSALASHLERLAGDQRYVAVCRSGARSRSATSQLRRRGFDVVNLRGGMRAWSAAGLPLEPRKGRVV